MKRTETLEQLQAQIGGNVKIKSVNGVPIECSAQMIPTRTLKPKKIIRQSGRTPNETELRFESDYLKPMLAAGEINRYRFESIRLKLANGGWYKCEWTAVNAAGVLVFFEVKGGRPRQREAGILTIKVAAAAYPEFQFFLAQWKDGEWTIQRILP